MAFSLAPQAGSYQCPQPLMAGGRGIEDGHNINNKILSLKMVKTKDLLYLNSFLLVQMKVQACKQLLNTSKVINLYQKYFISSYNYVLIRWNVIQI